MAGYNSRKIYDKCYNNEFINQQVNPCKYNLLLSFAENENDCTSLNGPRANKSRATGEIGNVNAGYQTDIESILFNLDIPDSRCITADTMIEKNKRIAAVLNSKKINYHECCNKQNTIYSRLDIPTNEFRSVYINRYGFPIVDPREFVYYGTNNTDQINNQRFGINTQLQAKDKISKPDMNPFRL